MKIVVGRNGLVTAALWAAFLYLLLLFMAFAVAPSPGLAAEPPHALVVLLSRSDDTRVETWRLLTDIAAPIGSEQGPTTSVNCAVEAMTRTALWLRDHMPGWEVKEWRCMPVAEVERFLRSHRAAEI
jgi:hypothetical protein